jgi:hypothetical protein
MTNSRINLKRLREIDPAATHRYRGLNEGFPAAGQ